ncbi:MAG TPA: hypothetical protein VGX25_25740 [Actinophytocola sp.]|uniref:hypothetical protein n=1 Tax=Actinophytocola sp. TaxID=1872138 RepID=UPI002DDD3B15|nr:hypothetical protein [Actinophytocola sp.]HEV2782808.1 hypothetical protein [Actinophytocola sp.]
MDTDPTRNVVVFQFGQDDERAAADAPTMDDDCVRQAWAAVQRERGARPEDVVALLCEWEPSIVDGLFIERMFPAATVYYSFERPDPDGWAEAFEAARQTMLRRRAEELESGDGELLPVLWSASSPWAELLEAMPHRTVVAGRVYVALASVAFTPRGTVGMSHLTHHRHRELGDVPFGELLAQAGTTLVTGLRIDGQSSAEGELLCLHRDGTPVASAVTLPDFHERMCALVGGPRLIVGLPCPQELLVADADSSLAGEVRDAVLSSGYADSELVPSVLLVEPGGIRLVAERQAGRGR